MWEDFFFWNVLMVVIGVLNLVIFNFISWFLFSLVLGRVSINLFFVLMSCGWFLLFENVKVVIVFWLVLWVKVIFFRVDWNMVCLVVFGFSNCGDFCVFNLEVMIFVSNNVIVNFIN